MTNAAHARHGQLVAAARRSRRAAVLDGRRAGRHDRLDGPAGRRLRLRLRRDPLGRRAARPPPHHGAPAGPEPRHREDARRAHRRPAARAGPADRLRRPAHHVPRRAPRLLVRRQPVPPPPGSEPPGARLAAARDGDRARVVVEPRRALRRHRLPRGHGAGAQRRRRRLGRLVDLGDAPGRRAAGRGAHRLRDAVRAGRAARVPRRVLRGTRRRRVGAALLRDDAREPAAARAWSSRLRGVLGGRAGRDADAAAAARARLRGAARRSRCGAAAHALGPHRDRLGHDRRLRLRRLPGPSGLDGAGRVARIRAREPLPAAPDLQPAVDAGCTRSTTTAATARTPR